MTSGVICREKGSGFMKRLEFKPSHVQRISSAVVGSPSFSRANGGRSASALKRRVSLTKWEDQCERTPVFHVEADQRNPRSLPKIWITEPAFDSFAEVQGREFVAVYPSGSDTAGEKALHHAQAYFGEALSYSESCQSEVKTECFRAAEILYLHAAQRGCVEAYVKLGVIYADDLCKGRYLHSVSDAAANARELLLNRARECFLFAAAHDNAEACWQLVELGLRLEDFDLDADRMFSLVNRSFDLASAQRLPVDKGNAALRLARLHEMGIGCEQSFRRAYAWYRIAEEELSFVVDQGGWYFKRARLNAQKGVLRMRQELVGGY